MNTSVERFLDAATLVVPLFLTTRVWRVRSREWLAPSGACRAMSRSSRAVVAATLFAVFGVGAPSADCVDSPAIDKCPPVTGGADREVAKPLPTADPIDPRVRELRSRRGGGGLVLLPEGAPGALEMITGIGDTAPAEPHVADADLVAEVVATDYQPFFHAGSTGIYTEFRLCIAQLVWNSRPAAKLEAGARIEVFRPGGSIRDSKGQTFQVGYAGPLRPLFPGRRFLVYLAWDEESEAYLLFGGYELMRSGRAASLNSRAAIPPRSASEVLKSVHDEVARARNESR